MSFSVWFCFQTRGAIFFLIGVVTLLLFDHDEKVGHMSDHESEHSFLAVGWSLCALYLLACQVRVTAGSSGLCQLYSSVPLFADSSVFLSLVVRTTTSLTVIYFEVLNKFC